MELKEIESAIEGILFAAGEPVGVERICLALEIDKATAYSMDDYVVTSIYRTALEQLWKDLDQAYAKNNE